MRHLIASIYTAAKIAALLPLSPSTEVEYKNLHVPKSWDVSVCRIFVSQNTACLGSTVAVYRQFAKDLADEHPDAVCQPIMCGSATIGAEVTYPNGTKVPIVWRGSAANLELGTAVAELQLDRPQGRIAKIKPLAMAERYVVMGRGRERDLDDATIAAAIVATARAQQIATGEVQELMRPLDAPISPPQVFEMAEITPAKRRSIINALSPFMDRDEQSDGTIIVSPLEWSDAKQANFYGVQPSHIAEVREQVGIRLQDVDDALNAAVNRLDELVREIKPHSIQECDLHSAASALLALMKL